jgi:lipopolysaccharide export system protein LptA
MNRIFIFAAIALLTAPAMAQTTGLQKTGDAPLEITARDTLEWRRGENLFVAKGEALAKQGDVSIAAETLTANYREDANNKMEIRHMTAQGNVTINSRDNSVYGQQADYDLDKGMAVMTGSNLRAVSPDQVVTARDNFEYWVTDGRLVANGAAKVVRKSPQGKTDTLEADKIIAVLKNDAKGQKALNSLEAIGNVVITTATETVTGARGLYRADTNTAEMTGGVTIKRGPNILEGDKATVDLNTNTSRMYGSETSGGRVRGVFYPGSEKTPAATP